MEQSKLISLITQLKLTYPYYFKDMSSEEFIGMSKLYSEHFKNYDYKLVEKAIFNITSTEEYMPSIARIKKEISNMIAPSIPRAEDEWNKVLDLVHKYGSYNEEKALSEMNNYTRYIVSHIGFKNICLAENQTWNKKEFLGEYEELKDKNIKQIQIESKNMKLLEEFN